MSSCSPEPAGWFPVEAESQDYHPRYAMTSKEGVVLEQNNVPADQWHRAVLAGRVPSWDVPATRDPGGRPLRTTCDDIIGAAGVAIPSRTSEHVFLVTCDGLFFLRETLSHATTASAAAVQAGAAALGTSYRSAMTFDIRFGRGRCLGADIVRPATYDDNAQCFISANTSQRTG